MAHFASLPLSIVDRSRPETVQSKRPRLASTPATPSTVTADELLRKLGMTIESSPPLPLKAFGFNFLKSLDLSSVGITLAEIPFDFGWKLVEFRPSSVETMDEPRSGVETGWEEDFTMPDFDLNEPHPGPDPVRGDGSLDQTFWGCDSENSEESTPQTVPPFTGSLDLEVPFDPTPIAISPPSPNTSPPRPTTKPSTKPTTRPSQKATAQPTPRPTRKYSNSILF